MTAPLTVGTLYEALRPRLHLEWIAGRLGGAHEIDLEKDQHSGSSLAGPLNFVRPCQVPVLGRTELAYLDGLESNSRRDAIDRLVDKPSEIVIIGDGLAAPDDLRKRAEAAGVPLFQSQLDSQDIVTDLQYYLSHHFAEKTTLHGVFMEVMGIGVLITGDASIGKSELALELVSRGHRLIADDSPVFARIAPDLVNGTCPEVLRDFLEVLGPEDDIARFEYLKKSARNFGSVLIGIETRGRSDFGALEARMSAAGFTWLDITDDTVITNLIV